MIFSVNIAYIAAAFVFEQSCIHVNTLPGQNKFSTGASFWFEIWGHGSG